MHIGQKSCTRGVADVAALSWDDPDFFPLRLAVRAAYTRHLEEVNMWPWEYHRSTTSRRTLLTEFEHAVLPQGVEVVMMWSVGD